MFSEIMFTGKITRRLTLIFDGTKQPDFEVKGRGQHGVAFAPHRFNKSGHRYEVIDTVKPIFLNATQSNEMMQCLDMICTKHGLKYLGNKIDGNGKAKIPMREIQDDDFVIYEGNNRMKHRCANEIKD